MEGRTIVRPDGWRCHGHHRSCHPSMEGRTIVRPDLPAATGTLDHNAPSMEGRTIVRPDDLEQASGRLQEKTFNGGPDNRPARPAGDACRSSWAFALQWRAGQSSGQTKTGHVPTGKYLQPSMEGRTIVRPDSGSGSCCVLTVHSFNGGPDNRPARLTALSCTTGP